MLKWFNKEDKSYPDFSEVDSKEKALELASSGVLVKLHLFPIELGGADDVRNIVFVPQFVVDLKGRFDLMVMDLLKKGFISNYLATPKYKGDSFIPSAIDLKVIGQRSLEETINIW